MEDNQKGGGASLSETKKTDLLRGNTLRFQVQQIQRNLHYFQQLNQMFGLEIW